MRLGVGAALIDGALMPGDVAIDDGLVREVGLSSGGGSRLAIPGFVDLQVNGFAGVDFLAHADYQRAGEALLQTGVTAYQPTFITAPESALFDALAALPTTVTYPRIIGAHLEGPFVSPERLGAHPGEHRLDPDREMLDRLLSTGRVTEMTLAPELPGALDLIPRLLDRRVTVSAGHTNATADEAHLAFDLGVATVTHAFNAMRPLLSRDPGIVGAALTRDDVAIQIIVDGHHLADETVRLVWRAASGRVALVTDATAAAAADGGRRHRLGEMEISSAGGPPTRPDGVLAGTALTMIEAVRNLHGLGIPLTDAIIAATAMPAKILGRRDLGTLERGGRADVVVLDDRLEIEEVLCEGESRL